MATLAQIRNEIDRKVDDTRVYTPSVIDGFINQGLIETAGVLDIPALKASDTLETDTSNPYKVLPSDYDHGLFHVYNTTTSERIKIYENLNMLLSRFQDDYDESGSIYGVAVERMDSASIGRLYYARTPSSANTLRLHYYSTPSQLSAESDVPYVFPAHLQRPILVNYACWRIFEEIYGEDPEGQMVIARYEKGYNAALSKLFSFYPPQQEPVQVFEAVQWGSFE